MTRSPSGIRCSSMQAMDHAWQSNVRSAWWSQHREATLNWLALGLLLAAWNASDNDAAADGCRRPESLRGYSHVSVRAATLRSSRLCTLPRNP
jgi:hypothetical protein